MLRILAVGNSFSEDATYYLHQILEIAGVENQVVTLVYRRLLFGEALAQYREKRKRVSVPV